MAADNVSLVAGNAVSNFTTKIEMPQMTLVIILYGTIFYSIIFVVGVVGNLLVIYVMLKEKELRNFTNYLLANLSLADLMVLFTCVPSGLHDLFAKERWYLGVVWCYLVAFIENCMGFASILSIFFITWDRYYVICKPLVVKSKMTQSRTLKLIIFIWVVSIFIHLPFIFLTEYRLEEFYDNPGVAEYKCNAKSAGNWSFYYIIGTTFIFYVIIGVVLVVMFIRISRHLEDSASFLVKIDSTKDAGRNCDQEYFDDLAGNSLRVNRTISNNQKLNHGKLLDKPSGLPRVVSLPSALGGGGGQSNTYSDKSHNLNHHNEAAIEALLQNQSNKKTHLEKHVKQRRQLIFMLMCVLFTFYICLFPLKIWNLTILFVSKFEIRGFYRKLGFHPFWFINITVRIFFYLNSSINPILYNFLSKKFRNGFKRLLIFRMCVGGSTMPPSLAETTAGSRLERHHLAVTVTDLETFNVQSHIS